MRSRKISCMLLIIFLMSLFWLAYWSLQMISKPNSDLNKIYYVDETLTIKFTKKENKLVKSVSYSDGVDDSNNDYEPIDLNKDTFNIDELTTRNSLQGESDYDEKNYIEISDKDRDLGFGITKNTAGSFEQIEKDTEFYKQINDMSNKRGYEKNRFNNRDPDIPLYGIPRMTKKNPFKELLTTSSYKLEMEEEIEPRIFESDINIIKNEKLLNLSYALIHNGVSSIVKSIQPNNFFSYNNINPSCYILKSKRLHRQIGLRPFVGNGIIGTTVHSPNVFISGVYNGIRELSHKASIPSTCSYNITSTLPVFRFRRNHLMNLQTGIYSEKSMNKNFIITHSIYAHRVHTYLMVTQVEFEQIIPLKEDIKLNINFVNAWASSYDISFIDKDFSDKDISYKIGRVNAKETNETKNTEIHILYDHVPKQLMPLRNFIKTKWTFLTAYGFSKDEVVGRYNQGMQDLHSNDRLFTSHIDEWSRLWSAGRIDVFGDDQLAQVVYSSWYHLLSSLPIKSDPLFVGLSSDGVSLGEADKDYQGRISIHQEMYMFPPILLFHKKLALNILASRKSQYQMAEKNAKLSKAAGLVYPFYSAKSGLEVHLDINMGWKAPQVSAAILLSLRNYLYSTNHTSILTGYMPMISGICNFLQSRLSCTEFLCEVLDVSVNEWSDKLVSNPPMVIELIRLALNLLEDYRQIHKELIDRHLINFASKLQVKYMQKNKIQSAYDGYMKGTSISELDASLIGYPIPAFISTEDRLNNLEYYSSVINGHTSPMTWSMQSIGFNEVGDVERAENNFQKQLPYCNGDFKIWLNKTIFSSETCSHFLPAAGSFLQSIIHGYFGIRITRNRLNLNPRIMKNVTSIHLVGLDYLGSILDFQLNKGSLTVTVTGRRKSAPVLILTVIEPEEIRTLNTLEQVTIDATKSFISVRV